jgi:hypothetical protein
MRKRRLVPLLVGQKTPTSTVEMKFLGNILVNLLVLHLIVDDCLQRKWRSDKSVCDKKA